VKRNPENLDHQSELTCTKMNCMT